MSELWIDADGCPVVEQCVEIAQEYGYAVTIVCDTSHMFSFPYAKLLMADKGKDQADFLLLRHVKQGDIVITQDYGLAALVLAKKAKALSQNGLCYNNDNIEALLASRHAHAQQRKHKHYSHIAKRTKEDDIAFVQALKAMIEKA